MGKSGIEGHYTLVGLRYTSHVGCSWQTDLPRNQQYCFVSVRHHGSFSQ